MVQEGRHHLAYAQEAGHGRLSLVSVLAGLVTAYGTFAIIAALVGAVLASLDVDTEFNTNDWTGSGATAALASGISLLVAYFFGGYVAGRMARRSAVLHGISVFVGSLVVIAVVSGVIRLLTDDTEIRDNLRSIGLPTDWDQVTGVAIAGAILSLVAMLIGSVAGALVGERWHTKLAAHAADPSIGRSAALRDAAEQQRVAAGAEQQRVAAPAEPVSPEHAMSSEHAAPPAAGTEDPESTRRRVTTPDAGREGARGGDRGAPSDQDFRR